MDDPAATPVPLPAASDRTPDGSAAGPGAPPAPVSGRRKTLRILLRVAAGLVILLVASLLGLWGYRVWMLTRPGWTCFPLVGHGIMPQNLASWYAGRSYGRKECRRAIEEASDYLRRRVPDARVAYMDVSARQGGRFFLHRSHRDGGDVDILFIGRTPEGGAYPKRPSLSTIGYTLKYNRSRKHGDLTFDARANWLFLEGLYNQQASQVDMIFVEPYIREWLMQAARETHASPEARAWAGRVLIYAGGAAADHKDHMHVRFKK